MRYTVSTEGKPMTIYERIKRRRKELGLSADQVAKALGVSRATVYRYESKDIEKIPFDTIQPLADVLQCPVEYLMGWDKPDKTTVLMQKFSKLSPEQQDDVLQYIDFLSSKERR